jgi:sulfane dehydrogenase subunit SoxC
MVIMSRAIDETGYVQPSLEQLKKVRGEVSFYHNNATQPWRINSNGEDQVQMADILQVLVETIGKT